MGWRITVKAGRVRDIKNKRRKTGKKRGWSGGGPGNNNKPTGVPDPKTVQSTAAVAANSQTDPAISAQPATVSPATPAPADQKISQEMMQDLMNLIKPTESAAAGTPPTTPTVAPAAAATPVPAQPAVETPPATSSPTSSSTVPPSTVTPSIEAPAPAPASAEPLPKGSKVKYKTNPGKEFVVEGPDNTKSNKIYIRDPTDEKEGIFLEDKSKLIAVPIPTSGTAQGSTSSTLTAATSGTSVPEPVLGTAQGSTTLTAASSSITVPDPALGAPQGSTTLIAATSGTTVLGHILPRLQDTIVVKETCIGKLVTGANDGNYYMIIKTTDINAPVYLSATSISDGKDVRYTIRFPDKKPEINSNPLGTILPQSTLQNLSNSNINTMVDTLIERRKEINQLTKTRQIKRNAGMEQNAVQLNHTIKNLETQLNDNIKKHNNFHTFSNKFTKKMTEYTIKQHFINAINIIKHITLERDVIYDVPILDEIYTQQKQTLSKNYFDLHKAKISSKELTSQLAVVDITSAESPIKKLINAKITPKYKLLIRTIGKLPYTSGTTIKYVCDALLLAEELSKYDNNVIKTLYTYIYDNLQSLYKKLLLLYDTYNNSPSNLQEVTIRSIFTDCFTYIATVKQYINKYIQNYSAEQLHDISKSKSIFFIPNRALQIQFDSIIKTYLTNITTAEQIIKQISDIT